MIKNTVFHKMLHTVQILLESVDNSTIHRFYYIYNYLKILGIYEN